MSTDASDECRARCEVRFTICRISLVGDPSGPRRVDVARMRRHMERDRIRYFWTRDENKHLRDDAGVSR